VIESIEGPNLTAKSRSGEALKVKLADNNRVSAVVKASDADLKPNTYVGVTSVAAPDGSDKAVAVHIFPEDRRGTAEGRILGSPPQSRDDERRHQSARRPGPLRRRQISLKLRRD
jgi:hypothetical protein